MKRYVTLAALAALAACDAPGGLEAPRRPPSGWAARHHRTRGQLDPGAVDAAVRDGHPDRAGTYAEAIHISVPISRSSANGGGMALA